MCYTPVGGVFLSAGFYTCFWVSCRVCWIRVFSLSVFGVCVYFLIVVFSVGICFFSASPLSTSSLSCLHAVVLFLLFCCAICCAVFPWVLSSCLSSSNCVGVIGSSVIVFFVLWAKFYISMFFRVFSSFCKGFLSGWGLGVFGCVR